MRLGAGIGKKVEISEDRGDVANMFVIKILLLKAGLAVGFGLIILALL